MKIFISADIEGVTGVTQWEETEHGGKDYEMARRQMSLEAAAACESNPGGRAYCRYPGRS